MALPRTHLPNSLPTKAATNPTPVPLHSTRILKVLPFLSILCILVGVTWLLLLPLDKYSRNTYISENALLPGGVHTYFSGSEQNVFRAYRHEVKALGNATNDEMAKMIGGIFKGQGLKVATQKFRYEAGGEVRSVQNATLRLVVSNICAYLGVRG